MRTSSSWTETGITWANKPAADARRDRRPGAVSTGAWVEWDVTPLVTGAGQVDCCWRQAVSDGVNFHSRESRAPTRRPELVVTVSNEAYARPLGASPLALGPRAGIRRLHLGRTACTARRSRHASCNPPSPASDNLTVGTQDANGKASNSVGSFRYTVRTGDPGTPADEADVAFEFRLSDVRVAGTLADYSGEVQPRTTMRITDRRSRPGVNETGTVEDLVLPSTVPCAVTPDANTGAVCNVTSDASTRSRRAWCARAPARSGRSAPSR